VLLIVVFVVVALIGFRGYLGRGSERLLEMGKRESEGCRDL
jgi:hypothetical protein